MDSFDLIYKRIIVSCIVISSISILCILKRDSGLSKGFVVALFLSIAALMLNWIEADKNSNKTEEASSSHSIEQVENSNVKE